jgi:hypothetical protein
MPASRIKSAWTCGQARRLNVSRSIFCVCAIVVHRDSRRMMSW